MSYAITPLEDGRIYVITFNTDFDFSHEMEPMVDELNTLLERAEHRVMLVNDLQNLTLKLDDLLQAGQMARHRDRSMFHHPRVQGIAVVSTSRVVQLSAKGLNSATFGGLHLPVFATIDEAVSYARSQLYNAV